MTIWIATSLLLGFVLLLLWWWWWWWFKTNFPGHERLPESEEEREAWDLSLKPDTLKILVPRLWSFPKTTSWERQNDSNASSNKHFISDLPLKNQAQLRDQGFWNRRAGLSFSSFHSEERWFSSKSKKKFFANRCRECVALEWLRCRHAAAKTASSILCMPNVSQQDMHVLIKFPDRTLNWHISYQYACSLLKRLNGALNIMQYWFILTGIS